MKKTLIILSALSSLTLATSVFAQDYPDIYLNTASGYPLTVIARVTSPTTIDFSNPSNYLTCSPINSFRGLYPQNYSTNLNYQLYNPALTRDGDNYSLKLANDFYLFFKSKYPLGSVNEWGSRWWSSNLKINCLGNVSGQLKLPTYTSDFNFLKDSLRVQYIGTPGRSVTIPRTLLGYYGYSLSYNKKSELPFLPNQAVFALYVEGSFTVPSNTCTIKTQTLDMGTILPGMIVDKKLNLNVSCIGPGLSGAKWTYNNVNNSGTNMTNLNNVKIRIKNNKDEILKDNESYFDINDLNNLSVEVDAKSNAEGGKLNVPLRFTLTYS